MKVDKDRIAYLAEQACFYVTPMGTWLRMQWCDMEEGKFCALDENSGEEYTLTFEEVSQDDDPHFEQLVRMKV